MLVWAGNGDGQSSVRSTKIHWKNEALKKGAKMGRWKESARTLAVGTRLSSTTLHSVSCAPTSDSFAPKQPARTLASHTHCRHDRPAMVHA